MFEKALELADQARLGRKQVLIVDGGPGTGKSVVAINLLVELTRRERLAHYVTRNAAPRAVYESKLTGSFSKSHITNLFKGSGAYTEAPRNSMDVLIVDEAHRLNEKSGLYQNLGENQIKEIIGAAQLRGLLHRRGPARHAEGHRRQGGNPRSGPGNAARRSASMRTRLAVPLQRLGRLPGLGRPRAADQGNRQRHDLEDIDYDFRVFDSPNELRALIAEKNYAMNKARMVAGYCWDWKGKKDPGIYDIVIPEHDFEMRWNLDKDGGLWAVMPNSVQEVGCIHTCQGLELDYVGVIIWAGFGGAGWTERSPMQASDPSRIVRFMGTRRWRKEDPETARKRRKG